MTFDEYQQAMRRTAGPAYSQEDALQLSALGLCGETGEFADAVKKHVYHGHPLPSAQLFEELGDILWYITRACDALDLQLDTVAAFNIHKLQQRYPNGFSSERSINRGDDVPLITCPICGAFGFHSFSCPERDA